MLEDFNEVIDAWRKESENLILTYVPDAEFLTFLDALIIAYARDESAARMLLDSLVEGDVL